MKINGTTVASGAASGAISLNVGANVINTVVTAADGASTTTYAVTVIRATSSIADLISLVPSSGTLSPAFASATTAYTDSVLNAASSITLTLTASDTGATIKVNGVIVASGTASGAISLNVGSNVINTVITASDGTTTKTYAVTVNRAAASTNADLTSLVPSIGSLSPTFASATTAYTESVPNATTSITLAPTVSDISATVTVNGVTVASGTASGAISLNVGANTINTVVTAADGSTKKTYVVTVTRAAASTNADLSSLLPSVGSLSPTFASGTLSYTDSVSNSTTSITFTPTQSDSGATVTVNGVAVASGTASGAITLNVGSNTVNTVVTAADGSTKKTYVVAVTRTASTNADLTSLVPSVGTLSPTFSSGTLNYTDSVSNVTTSITMTPMVSDIGATVKVNNVMVASGAASGAMSLNVGANVINTVVIAADGVTTKTYTVTVNRAAASTNADLTSLVPSVGTLSPTFTSATTTYAVSVSNTTTRFTLTPMVSDSGATVMVNGVIVASGTASGAIILNVGTNTINTVVTAADGVATKIYVVTVTLTIPPTAPVFLSTPTANPNPVTVGQTVQLVAAATNPLPVTYAWDCGDGTLASGAATSHIFTHAGAYTLSVTATSSANMSTSAPLTLTVNPLIGGNPGAGSATLPGEMDSDGDGYSDNVEIAAGTNPKDPTNAPGGLSSAPPAVAIFNPVLKINTKKSTLTLNGAIQIPASFAPTGKILVVDVAGYTQHFSLDLKGNGVTGTDKWKMVLKLVKGVASAQNAKFTLTLAGVPASVQSNSPLILVLNGAVFSK